MRTASPHAGNALVPTAHIAASASDQSGSEKFMGLGYHSGRVPVGKGRFVWGPITIGRYAINRGKAPVPPE